MKRMIVSLVLLLPIIVWGQYVGIGEPSPVSTLDVKSPYSRTARFNSPVSTHIEILENDILRGYWGSVSGASEDVDFGTTIGNTTGKVHLTTERVPRLTINPIGYVGIGVVTPLARLDVKATASLTARFNSPFSTYIDIVENDVIRGYWGSIAGAVEDIDMGTSIGNTTGKVHLTIERVPQLTVNTAGNIGLGTTSPGELLTLEDGNLWMKNTNKGILLNAADRPFITRGFDPFTSGTYSGLGRWGIFMEPSRLTFGMPNIVGKAFQFATYEANSTETTILTIDRIGQVKRPASGNVDLLPYIIGVVGADGTVISGSGNFTVERFISEYYISFSSGLAYNEDDFVVMITAIRGAIPGYGTTTEWSNGRLRIHIVDENGILTQSKFQFVVYKLN